jgi:hypothetical protein
VPVFAATTWTVIVHEAIPAVRSPPTTPTDDEPAAAVTANGVPVASTHVPPWAGVGAITTPLGRAVVNLQSVFAFSSLVLVIVNVKVEGLPAVTVPELKATSSAGVTSSTRRLSTARSLPPADTLALRTSGRSVAS